MIFYVDRVLSVEKVITFWDKIHIIIWIKRYPEFPETRPVGAPFSKNVF